MPRVEALWCATVEAGSTLLLKSFVDVNVTLKSWGGGWEGRCLTYLLFGSYCTNQILCADCVGQ